MTKDSPSEAVSRKRSGCGVDFGLAGFVEVAGRPIHRLEPCQPRLKIIIAQHDIALGALHESAITHKAFVVGPSCQPLHSAHDGALTCAEIDLPPWAAIAVLGQALHHEPLALCDLIGSTADELVDHLSETADWQKRLAHIESFVTHRLDAGAQRISPEIRWAWERLERYGGRTSISALADEIGWSGRHFGQRFAEETGIKPKAALRIMRFDRARHRVDGTSQSLADIAFLCGYADQSHMTREFLAFAGRSPDAHRKARLLDVPGTSSLTAGA